MVRLFCYIYCHIRNFSYRFSIKVLIFKLNLAIYSKLSYPKTQRSIRINEEFDGGNISEEESLPELENMQK